MIDVRITQPHEYRLADTPLAISLLDTPPDDERWNRSLPSWDESVSFSAWDGDTCVGHACQFPVDTTVPGGGRLSTGAVSRVGVLPTHRRRGVATRLMHALIDDALRRHVVLLSLRASEAIIYPRYGFGVAGEYCAVTIDPARATPLRGATTDGSFRILDPDEIVGVIDPLYERVGHRRPGALTRPPSFTERLLRAAIERKDASFVAVHLDPSSEPDGYVHYDLNWRGAALEISSGEGVVHDLFAASDEVELALWQFLFDTDLVTSWRASARPLDDLVRFAAADRRGHQQVGIQDEQWLRLLDVDAALSARSYHPATGSIAIRVSDPLVPANNATWRIDADGADRTSDAPDLSVGIETLSAAYLGGPSWAALAGTGAVEVAGGQATEVADTLFASRPLPFCGTFF